MSRCKYRIEQSAGRSVVIRDVGGERDLSVTNDAEAVVEELFLRGLLPEGRLIYYFDSDGRLDQIRHSGGVFIGFAPGPEDGRIPS